PLPLAKAAEPADPAFTPAAKPSQPRRPHTPSTPPMPRHPTPAAPLPVARLPAHGAPAIAREVEIPTEPTDITTVPEQALPEKDAVAAAPEPVKEEPKPEAKPQRSGGMRASEIMAAIPTDDWTMSPDASAPVVLPASQKLAPPNAPAPIVVEAKTRPKGPPTGDWTMQADPNAPDGWAAPAKVQKIVDRPPDVPAPTGKPATGNPVITVASDKAINIQQWEDKPTGIGEPLVEIDSTLMEPLKPMPADDAAAPPAATGADPPPLGPMPPRAPTVPPPLAPMFAPPPLGFAATLPPPAFGHATGPQQALPAGYATGPQQALPPGYATGPQQALPGPEQQAAMMGYARMVTDGGTNFFRDSEQVPRYASDPAFAVADRQRRKRVLIVAVGSAIALVALVVAIVVVTGGKKSAASPAAGSAIANVGPAQHAGSATIATGSAAPAVGAGSQAVVEPPPEPGSAGSAAVTKPDTGSDSKPDDGPTVGPGTCKVEVMTSPPGAQIFDEHKPLGTTPATLELPCGVEAKLTVHKSGFFSNQKIVKPGIDSKLEVSLVRAIFSMKVTSMPAGATITVGGKSMGVTPTTIKLPAYTPATITVTKDGYAPDTQKVSPRQNNMAHHVNLRRVSGGRRR
ncbi:MAG: PEGA domain-containing protein, partial [Acidobacteriota bacterium]